MADFSLSDLLADAGTNTGNFVKDAANNIADAYCEIYRDYPQFIVGANIDPIQPFRRAMVDSLCSGRDPGLPPAPTPPFTGGQCQGNFYFVNFDYEFFRYSSGLVENESAQLAGYGKIRGIRRSPEPEQTAVIQLLCHESDGVTPFIEAARYGGEQEGYVKSVTITSIVLRDDGIDNCGNPPDDFPSNYPPPEALNPSIPYTNPSGGNNFNFPVLFTPVTNNLTINVPVDLDVDFEFNFDAGGVTFNTGNGGGGGDGSFTPDDRGTLGDAASNAGNASNKAGEAADAANGAKDAANAAKDAAEAAKDAADAAKRNTDPPPPPGSDEVDENDRPDGDNDREGIENLLWVKITLTSLPFENKRQFGEGSPNVYYAGWFEFKAGGVPLPRMPVNFQESLFQAPKGADGYAYCLVSGAEGFATEITRKVEV